MLRKISAIDAISHNDIVMMRIMIIIAMVICIIIIIIIIIERKINSFVSTSAKVNSEAKSVDQRLSAIFNG